MTNPKTPRSTASPAKDPSKDQDELLRQLVRLADSVQALAERQTTDPEPPPTPTTSSTPADDERDKVEFAYRFLSELLVRSALNGDLLNAQRLLTPRAQVTRNGDGLTFPALNGADEARVRAGRTTEVLRNLQPNVARRPGNIPDSQLIDSIILLDDGVPVGIALCVPTDQVNEG
jgi:hypothetical protein